MFETESSKMMTIIGLFLIMLGAMLLFFNQSNYMQTLREEAQAVTDYSEARGVETPKDEQREKNKPADADSKTEKKTQPFQAMEEIYQDLGVSKAVQYYFNFMHYMEQIEIRIQDFDNPFLIVICLLGLFAVKSFIPFVPVSLTCFLSGVVLPFWAALLVNCLGLASIFAIKYFWGRSRPSNYIHKAMRRFPTIESIVEGDTLGSTHGNPILLFALRMVPSIPINTISQLYGYMEFHFGRYMLLSMLGFSVKLVVYTVIGANVYDPFQSAFMLPFAIILIVSGSATMGLASFLSRRKKKSRKEKEMEKALTKEKKKQAEAQKEFEEPDEI